MRTRKVERVAIFIDGSNFYHSLKRLKLVDRINFRKFINELLRGRELANVFFYIAPLDFEFNPKKYWKHQKFLNSLRNIPKFKVVLCTLKKLKNNNGSFDFVIKGDDVCLANDFIVGAYEDLYDTAIIVSGDEDFVPIIKTAQKLKKKIGNAYFKSSSSETLRQVCNFSIPLNKMMKKIIN